MVWLGVLLLLLGLAAAVGLTFAVKRLRSGTGRTSREPAATRQRARSASSGHRAAPVPTVRPKPRLVAEAFPVLPHVEARGFMVLASDETELLVVADDAQQATARAARRLAKRKPGVHVVAVHAMEAGAAK